MRYRAVASDYDGTLATFGRVGEEILAAVDRLRESGRKFILVTGRELLDLLGTFPAIEKCDWIVGENGGLLYEPRTQETRLLTKPPSEAFVEELKKRGVSPISVGKTIVATWEPHETTVLQTIRDLGLDLQVIFNKGAVMVLPGGVTKASGLAAVLQVMDLEPHQVVGVGDAENDHAFLDLCGCSAAVANALPAVKEAVDIVTPGDHGTGVRQLIDELLANDLAARPPRHTRQSVLVQEPAPPE